MGCRKEFHGPRIVHYDILQDYDDKSGNRRLYTVRIRSIWAGSHLLRAWPKFLVDKMAHRHACAAKTHGLYSYQWTLLRSLREI